MTIEEARAAAKSLRWLAFNFPDIESPADESDRMCKCIHAYSEKGAEAIEEIIRIIENVQKDINPDLLEAGS